MYRLSAHRTAATVAEAVTPPLLPSEPSGTPGEGRSESAGDPAASANDDSGVSVPLVAGGATAWVLAAVTALVLRGRRRRSPISDRSVGPVVGAPDGRAPHPRTSSVDQPIGGRRQLR